MKNEQATGKRHFGGLSTVTPFKIYNFYKPTYWCSMSSNVINQKSLGRVLICRRDYRGVFLFYLKIAAPTQGQRSKKLELWLQTFWHVCQILWRSLKQIFSWPSHDTRVLVTFGNFRIWNSATLTEPVFLPTQRRCSSFCSSTSFFSPCWSQWLILEPWQHQLSGRRLRWMDGVTAGEMAALPPSGNS